MLRLCSTLTLDTETFVVVSDHDKGLIPADVESIPNAAHSFLSVHIKRNVASRFHTSLDGMIHVLARPVRTHDVDPLFVQLQRAHSEIAEYLAAVNISCWISAYFPVSRFGIMTSNASESMNSFIKDERMSAHLAILVRVTRKTNIRLATLRNIYASMTSRSLCPRIDKTLKAMLDSALRREIHDYRSLCEVKRRSADEFRVVDIEASLAVSGCGKRCSTRVYMLTQSS